MHQSDPGHFPGVIPGLQWYAIQTRSRHEKFVDSQLKQRGVTTFLPLVNELRRWSDRQKLVQLPLFSSYVFARFVASVENRIRIVRRRADLIIFTASDSLHVQITFADESTRCGVFFPAPTSCPPKLGPDQVPACDRKEVPE